MTAKQTPARPLRLETPLQCVRCGAKADLSVCWLLSSVGRAPRKQKCSRRTLLCNACIRGITAGFLGQAPSAVCKTLKEAYTQLADDAAGGLDQ